MGPYFLISSFTFFILLTEKTCFNIGKPPVLPEDTELRIFGKYQKGLVTTGGQLLKEKVYDNISLLI